MGAALRQAPGPEYSTVVVSLPIVAFSKDWHEDQTSNHHVLRELSKSRRVLWLNSVGTRTPSLASSRDLGKLRRKLGEFARGAVNVENDLWVFSPLVAPWPHRALAQAANVRILQVTLAALRRQLNIDAFELWTFLPNTAPYVGRLGERLSVYYCVDEWSMFSYVNAAATEAAERALLAKVDCVFAINEALAQKKRALHKHVVLMPHGVDAAHFQRALSLPPLPALAHLPRPVIGFYGTLQSWVDFEFIAKLARARPAWSFVLVGQALVEPTVLRGLANVTILPRMPHDQLPALCRAFDVGLIPYRIDERMPYVNPIKLREYLAAGLPVISTPVPEVMRLAATVEGCHVVDDTDAAVKTMEAILARETDRTRTARAAQMNNETWAARCRAQDAALLAVREAKGAR